MKLKVFSVCAVVFLFCGIVHADLNSGLVAHWSFDDCTAKDSSGNHNDGKLLGTQCVDGVIGKALLFNGTSDYVEVPNSSSLNPAQLTISAWINPLSILNTSDVNVVLNKEDQYEFGIAGQTGHHDVSPNELAVSLNPNWYWFNAGHVQPPIGKYTHVSITMDSKNNGEIYVNGVLKRTIAYNSAIQGMSNCLRIGARFCPNSAGSFFNGIVDEVRIYDRALSASEILQIYQGQGTCSSEVVKFTAGTPAKAADVNANFDALNCQIQALKAIVCKNDPTASVCQ
jgi:hypothetical protein